MKFVISALITLGTIPSFGKECSNENLEFLVSKTTEYIGINAQSKVEISKLFSSQFFLALSKGELRWKYYSITQKHAKQLNKILEDIGSLVSKTPECDKKYLFRLKN